MNQVDPELERFVVRLNEFVAGVAAIWGDYQARGPGRVDAALYERLEPALQELLRLVDGNLAAIDDRRDGLRDAIRQAGDYAHRCACTPQGLCFITGEAGLIPRQDQIAAMARALTQLADEVRRLEQLSEGSGGGTSG